jgi:dTDP-4-amino-4,6-dideoxygalactose transaminase
MQGVIPYSTSFITDEDKKAVLAVLDSNWLTRGKLTKELEAKLCELTGKKHAVMVNNGTTALLAAVEATHTFDVYTPVLTFSAVANAAEMASTQPEIHFHDVCEDTLCVDWNQSAGIDGTIVAMDYAGYPSLRSWPPHYMGDIVLDAAHSIGATINGEPNTKFANIATYSFHPTKTVTSAEGGAIVCDSDSIYEELLLLRNNGIDIKTGLRVTTGLNLHCDELSCALLLSQLTRLKSNIARKHEIAKMYMDRWKDDLRLILPVYDEGHAFHLYPVRLSTAVNCTVEEFRAKLLTYGVASQRHYRLLSNMPIYAYMNLDGCYPVAERAYERLVSIPMYAGLDDNQVRIVMNAVDGSLDAYSR